MSRVACSPALLLLGLALLALPAVAETPEQLAKRLTPFLESHMGGLTVRKELTKEACRTLVPVLMSEDPKIADGAARLLTYARYSPAANNVIAYYAYRLPKLGGGLLPRVKQFGMTAAEPLAALVLHHPSLEMQGTACQALCDLYGTGFAPKANAFDPADCKPLVMVVLKAPDERFRLQAIERARDALPEALRDAVFVVLEKDPSAAIVKAVTRAKQTADTRQTKGHGVPRITPERVLAGLRSPSWLRRCEVACLAETAWRDDIREALFPLLHDPDTRVRRAAARTLYKRAAEDKAIGPKLSDMLCGQNVEDQLAALLVLSRRNRGNGHAILAGGNPVWLLARRLTHSPDPRVRLAYVETCFAVGRVDEVDLPGRLRRDPNRAIVQRLQAGPAAKR